MMDDNDAWSRSHVLLVGVCLRCVTDTTLTFSGLAHIIDQRCYSTLQDWEKEHKNKTSLCFCDGGPHLPCSPDRNREEIKKNGENKSEAADGRTDLQAPTYISIWVLNLIFFFVPIPASTPVKPRLGVALFTVALRENKEKEEEPTSTRMDTIDTNPALAEGYRTPSRTSLKPPKFVISIVVCL